MKKSMLVILLLTVVLLSACTQIQTYVPGQQPSNDSQSPFNDTLNLTDSEEDTPQEGVEEIDLTEDEDDTEDKDVQEVEDDQDTEDEEPNSEITLEVTEGEEFDLGDLQAEDPDGDSIEFSYSAPLDDDGRWATQDGDEGTYFVDVTASDGLLSTTTTIKLIVNPSNKGPVIDCPSELQINEGETVEVPCTIFDQEGDEVSFEVSGYANDLTFTTGFDDAGSQDLLIVASDGNRETQKTISLTIANTNRPPVVEEFADIEVLEGDSVVLIVDANDPDGDDIEVSYPLIFDDDGRWTTEKGDAGTYELEIEVSDGEDEVTAPVKIVVEKVNSAPTLVLADSFEVDEGELIDLDIEVSDEDGDGVTVTIEGFMTSQTYQTTFEDAGEYEVTVTASDGKKEASKTASITINNVNRPPVFKLN